ncbi:unnamed protein product [Orchesella dallaii]|uniref:G-patch domain-containing protein n=1 Tax=Orchesella dallaii TaxID=48710 RepID=A0ABP1Q641_9HEXA
MGHSDDDDDCTQYGTALEPIEEDDVARKRPIAVSEQVAVDERGRRRFHGAFTGGFSAGYFNTVGSKEGWAPSSFKSSRSDRNNLKSQNVMDFMDDEDKGAFGIAPQVLRPTDEFTDKNEARGKKRPWQGQSEGPIPGVPVLEQIIQPVKETVGIKILIKMGWRPGKGVGAKIDKRERIKRAKTTSKVTPPDEEQEELEEIALNTTTGSTKTYGCVLPPEFNKGADESDDSLDDILEAETLLAPDDVRSLLCNPKQNTFGLGYKGLDRNTLTPATGHVDLFGSKLKFRVENKNMSISGQAFGVGAFEENDEDIYSKEDLSQYDFALETPEERRRKKAKEDQDKRRAKNKENCIEGFRIASSARLNRMHYSAPTLPPNFEPYHVVKKSRFETTDSNEEKQEVAAKGLNRHNLTISERQVLIEDDPNKMKDIRKNDVPATPMSSNDNDSINSVESDSLPNKSNEDIQRRIDRLKRFTQVLQAYGSKKPDESEKASFKPFMKNPEKQERYEKYITLAEAGFSECLKDLQPAEMTEWEREREKMEFDRASKLYKPMSSILSNRFTSAKSHDISHLEPEKELQQEKDPSDDPKVAAKMKLFGKLTHTVMEWHPDKLVCKRFNIPHPYPDSKFVGVKSDLLANRASTVGKNSNLHSGQIAVPVVKKSLFDNLDFSKPPPGLLPPESIQPPGLQKNSPDGSAEVDEVLVLSGSVSKPILEFHKEMAFSKSVNEDDEIITVEKPPLDLFKEIFADSSESEDEDMEVEPALGVNQKKENESQQFVSQLLDDGVRDDKSSDKMVRSNDRKSFPTEKESVNQKDGSKRGVFDRIDLDRLQAHTRNQNSEREYTKVFNKSTESDDDEDMDDIYGPRPPTSLPTSTLQPHSIASVSSSKRSTTTSASSTSMNYRSQSKPDDTTKEVSREEVIWVEKSALSDGSSKSHVKSKKHSSKSRRKSSKKEKRKTHKSKRHKHKKKGHKHKSSGKHDSTESSSEGDDGLPDSGASSNSSVTINDSLDNRALLAKLKQITRSN